MDTMTHPFCQSSISLGFSVLLWIYKKADKVNFYQQLLEVNLEDSIINK